MRRYTVDGNSNRVHSIRLSVSCKREGRMMDDAWWGKGKMLRKAVVVTSIASSLLDRHQKGLEWVFFAFTVRAKVVD